MIKERHNGQERFKALLQKVSGIKVVLLSVILFAVILTSALTLSVFSGKTGGVIDKGNKDVVYAASPITLSVSIGSYGYLYIYVVNGDAAINSYTGFASATIVYKGTNYVEVKNGASSGSGTISINSGNPVRIEGGTCGYGPSLGWSFTSFSGIGSGTASFNYTFRADTNVSLYVNTTQAVTSYTLTATSLSGGPTISPSGTITVAPGGSKTFTITVPSNGYSCFVKLDGVTVKTIDAGKTDTYTISAINANHTIEAASGVPMRYSITGTVGSGGTARYATEKNVLGIYVFSAYTGSLTNIIHSTIVRFSFSANTGYKISNVVLDGVSQGAITSLNITMAANHTLSVTFVADTYTITASAGTGGSISPGTTTVNSGGSQTFTATKSGDYVFAYFLIDGSTKSYSSSYAFSNVTANHTIAACFTYVTPTYTITASAATGGSISPSGNVSITSGGSQTFYAYANTDYTFAYFLVDGSKSYSSSYTFSGVTSGHTIVAYFTYVTPTYYITASAATGGSISPSGNVSVTSGGSQTFNAYNISGYTFAYFRIDNSSYYYSSSYTFSSVTSNRSIVAYFDVAAAPQVTYNITPSTTTGGSISPTTVASVAQGGSSPAYTATASTGYTFAYFKIDTTDTQYTNPYTIPNVQAHHTIVAYFTANTYNINTSVSPAGWGNITSSRTITYGGSSVPISFSANPGYLLTDVTINGTSDPTAKANGYYEVQSNVTETQTIVAYFEATLPTYTILVSVYVNGVSGTVSPSSSSVIEGGSTTITITPDVGNLLWELTINGVPLTAAELADVIADGGITLTNITEHKNLVVTFKRYNIITATSGANGSITPSGSVQVGPNGSQRFEFTPASGYRVLNIIVGTYQAGTIRYGTVSLGGAELADAISNGYTFGNVDYDAVISVEFALITDTTYTITASGTTGGATISPEGIVNVISGESRTFDIIISIPSISVLNILVDGVALSGTEFTDAINNGYTFSTVFADHTIEVEFTSSSNIHVITATAVGSGTILPGTVNVVDGTNRLFTFTHDIGYRVLNIIVDGNALSGTDLANAISLGYTFSNVTANRTIRVEFASDSATTHTITATAGTNGSINPLGIVSVAAGGSYTFAIAANSGYRVLNIIVDGAALTAGQITDALANGYIFGGVNGDHTIDVEFAPTSPSTTYTITATSGTNGSITPSGSISVVDGGSYTFAIAANSGYKVLNLTVDGLSLTGAEIAYAVANGYTFNGVNVNHTIDVTFTPTANILFTITATTGANGNITPRGSYNVVSGGNQTFILAPNGGYRVLNIIVDGNALSGSALSNAISSGYTFINVLSAHTIDVEFTSTAPTTIYTITATATSGGSINPLGIVSVVDGGSYTFAIAANSGYRVLNIIVDGNALTVGEIADAILYGYTFGGVNGNHTIDVEFGPTSPATTYAITSTTTAGGSINPLGTVSVIINGSYTFAIAPDSGYKVLNLIVDGIYLTDTQITAALINGYTFNNVNGNHTIDVEFTLIDATTFTITSTTTTGGTITPLGTVHIVADNSIKYLVAQNIGYDVTIITVDGNDFSVSDIANVVSSGHTFLNVTANHTISVTFEPTNVTQYNIKAIVIGGNGYVVPDGDSVVNEGANKQFIFIPNTGYEVAMVKINNVALTATELEDAITNKEYTFINVLQDYILTVTFVKITPKYTVTVSNSSNGTVSQSGIITVNEGDNLTLQFTPDSGYSVTAITVDGNLLNSAQLSNASNNGYTFTSIHGNHTINVTFGIVNPTDSWIDDAENAKTKTDDQDIKDKLDELIDDIKNGGSPEDSLDDYKDYLKGKLTELYDELTADADSLHDAELKKAYEDALAAIEAADSFTDATIAYEDGREALLAAANAKSQLSIWLVSLLGFETIIGAAILFITKRKKKLRA